MNASVAKNTENFSPVWAEYIWLARGERSRLYSIFQDFFREIETAAAFISANQLDEFRVRRCSKALLKSRLKQRLYSMSGDRKKSDYYGSHIVQQQRAKRDAAMILATDSLKRGALSEIMDRYGSDKASRGHNYTLLYERLFDNDRHRYARVLELGIGTNNVDTPCNMGPNGVPGASLRGWREYFDQAMIFGCDIDRRVLFEDERIKSAYVDQTDADSVEQLFATIGGQFDLIIDDGYHKLEANRTFYNGAFSRLKNGGIYVIEDAAYWQRDAYMEFLDEYDAGILSIPYQHNNANNCLAIVVKEN